MIVMRRRRRKEEEEEEVPEMQGDRMVRLCH